MATLVFSSLGVANPYTPPPTGWASPTTALAGRIADISGNIMYGRITTAYNPIYSVWYHATSLDAPVIGSKVVVGNANSVTVGGACIVDGLTGNGYAAIHTDFTTKIKIIKLTANQQDGADLLSVTTGSVNYTTEVRLELVKATNTLKLYKNGAQIGTDIVDSSYTPVYGGVCSAAALAKSVETYQVGPQITSINGGNPITAGQTGIAIVASGFTAKPTAVAATYASGAKSITATVDSGGTATNFNISIQDRIEAEDWPINGDTLTFTFTYSGESAVLTQTLVKKATETVLTVSGGITSDPATWTYWLTQDGFTVEGGEHDYIPYGDLVLTADGGGSATNAGTFTSWFRPATGTGAGNVYAYTWVITEAGISPAGSGLTSSGLTSSGLTIAGLTSSRL